MRKWKKNKRITNLATYEKERQKTKLFIIEFYPTYEKPMHISFLESMQFRTLENFMKRGMLYSAKEIKNDT